MTEQFNDARYATGTTLTKHMEFALTEYKVFLRNITAMTPHFADHGVTFELSDDEENSVENMIFKTPIGDIEMSRKLILEGKYVTYAVVFSDLKDEGFQTAIRKLWSLKLSWNTQWLHSNGELVADEFETDSPSPHIAIEVVRRAMATKLMLDTAAI